MQTSIIIRIEWKKMVPGQVFMPRKGEESVYLLGLLLEVIKSPKKCLDRRPGLLHIQERKEVDQSRREELATPRQCR
jgi:hypothetical protein